MRNPPRVAEASDSLALPVKSAALPLFLLLPLCRAAVLLLVARP